jgi:hypothetical protein
VVPTTRVSGATTSKMAGACITSPRCAGQDHAYILFVVLCCSLLFFETSSVVPASALLDRQGACTTCPRCAAQDLSFIPSPLALHVFNAVGIEDACIVVAVTWLSVLWSYHPVFMSAPQCGVALAAYDFKCTGADVASVTCCTFTAMQQTPSGCAAASSRHRCSFCFR